MPIPNEYREIIGELKRATEEGRVVWNTERFGVSVEVSGSLIELWGGEDSETERGFVTCTLKDPKGHGLRRDQPLDTWFVEEGDDDFAFMHLFFHAAKRQGLGIPQKLSEIADALKSSGQIGGKSKTSADDDEFPF